MRPSNVGGNDAISDSGKYSGDHIFLIAKKLPSFSRYGPSMPSGARLPATSIAPLRSSRTMPSSTKDQIKPPALSGLASMAFHQSFRLAPAPPSYRPCRNSVGMKTSRPLNSDVAQQL